MSYFKNVLSDGESLFKNDDALDLEWVPKVIPFRESQQSRIADCIKPLLAGRNGKNLFVYGDPGIGKTAATRWVLRDLEENTDEVAALYVNCWQKNSSYKVLIDICHQLGYKFTQNKNTDEIFAVIRNMLNKKAAVFVFDEVDKIEDFDFLYSIMNDIYKKSIVLITNYKDWLTGIEARVRSRLMPEMLEFPKYNATEIEGILRQRVEYAFVSGVWPDNLISLIAKKAEEFGDIRAGIFMLRESGLAAENDSSKKIEEKHVTSTFSKVNEQTIQKSTDLEEDSQLILDVIKQNSPRKIGELFNLYKEQGGGQTYKTFQRKIMKLEKSKFITTNKIVGGTEGTTTIITYRDNKKLTEF